MIRNNAYNTRIDLIVSSSIHHMEHWTTLLFLQLISSSDLARYLPRSLSFLSFLSHPLPPSGYFVRRSDFQFEKKSLVVIGLFEKLCCTPLLSHKT